MKIYNKLVRDKIPEIIASQGKKVTFRQINDDEYEKALKDKLFEEVNELVKAKTPEQITEELVDILEVLDAIRLYHFVGNNTIRNKREEKHTERGGFLEGYFLVSVEE